MKKVLFASVLISLLTLPVLVAALPTSAPTIIESQDDLMNLIDRIGNIIFSILLAVAAIFLIVAGFFFVTSGGSPENITKARQMLINALIGVGIALGARGLVALIDSILRP